MSEQSQAECLRAARDDLSSSFEHCDAVTSLDELGCIRVVLVPTGGRPGRRIEIHPELAEKVRNIRITPESEPSEPRSAGSADFADAFLDPTDVLEEIEYLEAERQGLEAAS